MIPVSLSREFLERRNARALRGALWEPDIEMLPSIRNQSGVLLTPQMVQPEEVIAAAREISTSRAEHRAGDLAQAVSVSFNIPWLELLCGCTAPIQPDTIWAEPAGLDYGSLSGIAFNSRNPWFCRLLETQERLSEAAVKDGFPVSLPVMHGPLDLLSAFRGPEQMCLDFLDRPADVKQALDRLTDLWIRVAEELLPLVPGFWRGCCSRMKLWFPGPCVTVQDDATGLVSPEFYLEFVREFEGRIVSCFDYHTYHSHSTSSHVLHLIADIPRLSSIQITLDPNGAPRPKLREVLFEVLERKPVQLSVWDRSWADWCEESFDPAGLCIAYIVRDERDWGQYEEWLEEYGTES